MTSPAHRTRADLLRDLCGYLPKDEAQLIRAMDPHDVHVPVAAFAAVKRHEIVLPEDLHAEVSAVVTALLREENAGDLTSVEVQVLGDVVVVQLVGEHDIHVIEDLRTVFLNVITPESNRVVVDLSRATFLDSIILGSLVAAQRRANDSGGWLRLAGPRPNVQNVLRLTKLDEVFAVFDDVAAAAS